MSKIEILGITPGMESYKKMRGDTEEDKNVLEKAEQANKPKEVATEYGMERWDVIQQSMDKSKADRQEKTQEFVDKIGNGASKIVDRLKVLSKKDAGFWGKLVARAGSEWIRGMANGVLMDAKQPLLSQEKWEQGLKDFKDSAIAKGKGAYEKFQAKVTEMKENRQAKLAERGAEKRMSDYLKSARKLQEVATRHNEVVQKLQDSDPSLKGAVRKVELNPIEEQVEKVRLRLVA